MGSPKIAVSPGLSSLSAIGADLLDQVCKEMPSIFKGFNCYPLNYNLKKIAVDLVSDNGSALSGHFEWSITLQLPNATASKDAYVYVAFDNDTIYLPPFFRDQLGRAYAINDAAIDKFLRAGAFLTDHEEPIRPIN